jgi:hypothetical protein
MLNLLNKSRFSLCQECREINAYYPLDRQELATLARIPSPIMYLSLELWCSSHTKKVN